MKTTNNKNRLKHYSLKGKIKQMKKTRKNIEKYTKNKEIEEKVKLRKKEICEKRGTTTRARSFSFFY